MGYRVGTECAENLHQARATYWREMGAEWGYAQSGQPYQLVVYYAVMPDVAPPVFRRVELLLDGTEYASSYQAVPLVGFPPCEVGEYVGDQLAWLGYVVGALALAVVLAYGLGWALSGRFSGGR